MRSCVGQPRFRLRSLHRHLSFSSVSLALTRLSPVYLPFVAVRRRAHRPHKAPVVHFSICLTYLVLCLPLRVALTTLIPQFVKTPNLKKYNTPKLRTFTLATKKKQFKQNNRDDPHDDFRFGLLQLYSTSADALFYLLGVYRISGGLITFFGSPSVDRQSLCSPCAPPPHESLQ